MTTYLGKRCSFCLPRVPFVNCRQFMYLVIYLLVLRAGCGIWLYQFLIIAYLFTSHSLIQLRRLAVSFSFADFHSFIQLCRLSQFHSALQTLTVSFSFADAHSVIQLCRLSQFHSALQTLTVSFSFADFHSFIQLCRLSQFHSALQTLTVSFSFADAHSVIQLCRLSQFHSHLLPILCGNVTCSIIRNLLPELWCYFEIIKKGF